MSTVISSHSVTVSDGVTAANFLEAAAKGQVKFHTIRADGTLRRVQFYAAGTTARAQAETIWQQREAGRKMSAIAAEFHLSVPSVRRILNALTLSKEVESLKKTAITKIVKEGK